LRRRGQIGKDLNPFAECFKQIIEGNDSHGFALYEYILRAPTEPMVLIVRKEPFAADDQQSAILCQIRVEERTKLLRFLVVGKQVEPIDNLTETMFQSTSPLGSSSRTTFEDAG
jgi:hypothetical protein